MSDVKKNSVLVVDDERLNLEVLINILSSEYTVYMTKNGSSAIDMANKYMPDVILLDIIMPGMTGYDVLEILKESEATRNIPVIFITGLNSIEDEEKGLDLGAADFISKPFSTKVVKSRVRNQIQLVNQIREHIRLQNELESAVEAAEAANQSKSNFLAKMSHEIRTPLNAVIGISEIHLQNATLEPEIREAFTRIFSSGDLLLGIINDILDMSKIEAGKMELYPEEYEIASLINDTVFLNMIKYENKPIDFKVNIDEEVPATVVGDPLRIKQILNNLLSNAFKYTSGGEVELSLASEETGDKTVLVFRVRDTGQGMTEEQLSTLFDEYSRFNQEANKMTEGTGLGMNITLNMIHMMDGDISADSEPGKGSLFTVRLPQGGVGAPPLGRDLVEKLRDFRSSYQAKSKKVNIERESLGDGSVLVVDDMDMNLYVAKGILDPYGLKIDTASSGFEAIEKVKSKSYDIVFMDHMMPGKDGIETTQEIRKLGGEYEKLPIVALTANAVAGMKEMFLSNGFNGFLSKPIVIQDMDKVLKQWLSPGKITHEVELKATEAEDETPDPFFIELEKIAVVDAKIGLGRLSGNKEMYKGTLEMFHKKLKSECDNMAGFLKNNEIKRFSIAVHAMKSLLATIGAMDLSKTALELEMAGKNNEADVCVERFPPFMEQLLQLHGQLSPIFSPPEAKSEKKPGDTRYLREKIQEALNATENFDTDSGVEIIRDLLAFDFGAETNASLENGLAALEEFDYDGVAVIFKAILS